MLMYADPRCYRHGRGRAHVAGGLHFTHAQTEEDQDVIQASSAPDPQVILRPQPEPGRQGPQAALPENRPHQARPTGQLHTSVNILIEIRNIYFWSSRLDITVAMKTSIHHFSFKGH